MSAWLKRGNPEGQMSLSPRYEEIQTRDTTAADGSPSVPHTGIVALNKETTDASK